MDENNKVRAKRSLPDWAALILTVAAVAGTAVGTNAALSSTFSTVKAHTELVSGANGETLNGGDDITLPSPDEEPPETEPPAATTPDTVPADPSETPTQPPADTIPPVIEGAADKSVVVGDTVSYREGVTVRDDSGGQVELEIDSSKVDLLTPGSYPLTYTARDESGNETSVTVTVTVTEPPKKPASSSSSSSSKTKKPWEATEEDVYALGQKVLNKILKDGMTQREKAYAIFKYVHNNISYVGTSDKSSWIAGAYEGFTSKRGDCYTYFACSKVLLTLAGIPNVDLERVGGTTRHYWQLVDVGEGYKHFDACPHSHTNVVTFLLTETEARAFTASIAWYRPNYYVYDYANCPVPVVGLDESERNPQTTEPETPLEPETPEVPEDSDAPKQPADPADPETPGEPETPEAPDGPINDASDF